MFRLFPKLRSSRVLLTFLIILLLSGAVLATFIWIGASHLIIPKRRALEPRHHALLDQPHEFGLDLEPRSVPMHDGILLDTILVHPAVASGTAAKTRKMQSRLEAAGIEPPGSPRGTVFLLHGRGGLKENMLSVAQRFVAADFRCIVYDARAHGTSAGRYCTFGKKEVHDFSALLDFYEKHLAERGETIGPVFAMGNSLGAAVILQVLADEPRIEAAVAVVPFAELGTIVKNSGQQAFRLKLPDSIVRLAVNIGGARAGFDPFSIRPVESIREAKTPLMVVHGTIDEIIPIEHARRIYEASPSENKAWREIPTGKHYNVLAEGGDDLYEEILLFLLGILERR